MKKTLLIACFVVVGIVATREAHAQAPEATRVLIADASDSSQLLSFPMDVMTIIDGKCYGCHSPNAKNDKSKNALQWVLLQQMDDVELVGALDEVMEVLEEGSMPPAKMLERYPHLKLTDEESAKLKEWVEGTMSTLMDE